MKSLRFSFLIINLILLTKKIRATKSSGVFINLQNDTNKVM